MKTETLALLVIDIQQVAFDGKVTAPITNGPDILAKISTLIDACRQADTPVIYVQTCAPSGRPYAKDVHGWNIHPQVAPAAGEAVIFKVGPSGFESKELEGKLARLGTTTLIVCGIWTEGCVSITCRGALKRGFGVCLAADGHSTVRDNVADASAIVAEQHELLSQRGAEIANIKTLAARVGKNKQ